MANSVCFTQGQVLKRFWRSTAIISTVALLLASALAVSQASQKDVVEALADFDKAMLWACYFASAMGWSYGRYRASACGVDNSSGKALFLAFPLGVLAALLVYLLLPALAAPPSAGKEFAPAWIIGFVFSLIFALAAGATLQFLAWTVRVWFEGIHKYL